MSTEDLQQQTHRALIIFIALAKVQNESYTQFLGMFKHDQRMYFNHLINASNAFINTTKKSLPPESVLATNQLEEYFTEYCFTLIKEKEFDFDKHSQVKKYLKKLNKDNNYHINEVLKLIENETTN